LDKFAQKIEEAKEVIEACADAHGFLASTDKYKEYWLRDFVYSQWCLLKLGYKKECKLHLKNFLLRIDRSGNVPARIQKPFQYMISISKRMYKLPMFVLSGRIAHPINRSYLSNTSKQPWAADNAPLAVIGIYDYATFTSDEKFIKQYKLEVENLINFMLDKADRNLLFLPGNDWRDAMYCYSNQFLFSNQVVLQRALRLSGNNKLAIKVEKNINAYLWNDNLGFYEDFPGSYHFDTLAHALAILYDLIPAERIERVIKAFNSANTKLGYKNLNEPYDPSVSGLEMYSYQNAAMWPFVQGYTILAFLHIGQYALAKNGFVKFSRLSNFNEWYDPRTKSPKGSRGQLWSAAAYLLSYEALKAKCII